MNDLNKIVKFTEDIVNGEKFNESEIDNILSVIKNFDGNVNIYKGILIIYYFFKFRKIPSKSFDEIIVNNSFLKCVDLLNKNILSPNEIEEILLNILSIPDNKEELRDVLMGSFYGALWPIMNDHKNFGLAVDYGISIIKSAFRLDNLDIKNKIDIHRGKVKVISLAGSGKKEIKLLNISSMTAIITAAVSRILKENIVVEKTISRSTSGVTGSYDIFELSGVNLNLSVKTMYDVSLKTGLGIFDINSIVPKLNHIYDGRLHNVQVFAGLVGGAAIVNPIDADLINYGLTRGSAKLCLAILDKLYPDRKIIVLQGKNSKGLSVVDQISIGSETEAFQNISGKISNIKIIPEHFGFQKKPFEYIISTNNQKENLYEFIKFLFGKGNKYLNQLIAMEVALNLSSIGIIDNLKMGANIALKAIDSGIGIEILRDLVVNSNGDQKKFNNIINLL